MAHTKRSAVLARHDAESMSGLVGLLSGIAASIAGLFRWIAGYEQRRAGRNEAALRAAVRESDRVKKRGKIDDAVRDLSVSDLERELRK